MGKTEKNRKENHATKVTKNQKTKMWDEGNSNCFLTFISVQGVKSLGGHFACLCRGFEFYEVKKNIFFSFSKRKWKSFYTFNHFYSEKSSKRAKQHKSTTMTPNLPE